MATIDWPAGLIPQAAQLSLRKIGAQFSSPLNGTLQAVDFIGERWTLSASLAAQQARDPNGVHAFCNNMAGGIERVRVWPFHTGGVPRGSMRGAPRVRVAAARGSTVLRVKEALSGANLIAGGGMEVDVADLAVGWTLYSAGATGVVGVSDFSGLASPRAQSVFCSSLGSSISDNIGVFRLGLFVTPGQPYTLSAEMRGGSITLVSQINWFTAGDVFVDTTVATLPGNGSIFQRVSATGVAPPTASKASIFLYARARVGGPASAAVSIDNVQFEAAPTASAWAGPPTLRAGDFVSAGGQLFQVAADCTLLDTGDGDIPLVNRVRSTIAVDSPVTWYRPTCEMVLPAMQAGPVHRPGVIESTALDLVEVW